MRTEPIPSTISTNKNNHDNTADATKRGKPQSTKAKTKTISVKTSSFNKKKQIKDQDDKCKNFDHDSNFTTTGISSLREEKREA